MNCKQILNWLRNGRLITGLVLLVGVVVGLLLFNSKNKIFDLVDIFLSISIGISSILFTLLAILLIKEFINHMNRESTVRIKKLKSDANKLISVATSKKKVNFDHKMKLINTGQKKFSEIEDLSNKSKWMKNTLILSLLCCVVLIISCILIRKDVWPVQLSLETTALFTFLIFYPVNYIIKFTIDVIDYLEKG